MTYEVDEKETLDAFSAQEHGMYHLQLPADMVVDELGNLPLQLEAVLVDSPDIIDIDLSAVEQVDTAGMQLLYAFARDVYRPGCLDTSFDIRRHA